MLKPEELQEIGRARTHQNNKESLEDYRKTLEMKRLQEIMLRKHEADDDYNAPAAERTSKQTTILENRLFPNIPLARYFIIPIWNTFAELFSGKRIGTNLLKISISFLVIAACITAVFFFPPIVSVFIANTFFSLPSLLTLVGIATVALYAGNFVANLIENYAHKDHWNRYECTRLQEHYFQKRYGINKDISQKIKAYLLNKESYPGSPEPIVRDIATDLLNKLRISDEESVHDIAVFFIEELKVLKHSKPDENEKEAFTRWKNDYHVVLEIVNSLDSARNLNLQTHLLLKESTGRRAVKAWIKRMDGLIEELEDLLKQPMINKQKIEACDDKLKAELQKIKIEEVLERPKYPNINLVLRKYNKISLRKKECEKVHTNIVKLEQFHNKMSQIPIQPESPTEWVALDQSLKKRLKI